mmetsp:Transcript_2521/g.5214  ORF Transcript_2521/g.5214 Transcript_2521/m.5214 type:complete len:80 (-) Transcript_2521:169-408(-)
MSICMSTSQETSSVVRAALTESAPGASADNCRDAFLSSSVPSFLHAPSFSVPSSIHLCFLFRRCLWLCLSVHCTHCANR